MQTSNSPLRHMYVLSTRTYPKRSKRASHKLGSLCGPTLRQYETITTKMLYLVFQKLSLFESSFLVFFFFRNLRQFVQFQDFQRIISRKVAHGDIFYFFKCKFHKISIEFGYVASTFPLPAPLCSPKDKHLKIINKPDGPQSLCNRRFGGVFCVVSWLLSFLLV